MLSENNLCSPDYILTWSFYLVSSLEGLRSCNGLNFCVLEKASSRKGKLEAGTCKNGQRRKRQNMILRRNSEVCSLLSGGQ